MTSLDDFGPDIGDKFEEHIRICMAIGDLLHQAKTICDAGEEPEPSLAEEISTLFDEGQALALEVGTALLPAAALIHGAGMNRIERLVRAYTDYARRPTQKHYDRILEIILDEFEEFKKEKARTTIAGKMMRYQ